MILNEGQKMKEVNIVNLGITEYIPESIGERSLDFEQRFKGNLVNLFKSVSIYI